MSGPFSPGPSSTPVQTEVEADRFERLARTAGPRVLSYLVRRTDPREDAADVHQRVLFTTWRRLAQVPTDDEAATAWMIAVARRELANHRRSTHRRSAATERLREAITTGERAAYAGSAEARTLGRELLAGLEPLDREVVELAYWDELTSEQIGAVVGLSAGAVRKRLQRAREALRVRLSSGQPVG